MDALHVTDSDILFACTNSDEYHLIILPTEKCNFHCSYCYEDHSVGKMSREVAESVKLLLARNIPRVSHLSIDWFGGEPLLGMSVIRDLNGFAKDFIGRNGLATELRSAITTNAFLLGPDVFAELLDLGVSEYQISLDGPKEFHDRTRVQVNGGGSFDRIWRNLMHITSVRGDFRILLRVHVTEENIDAVPDLLRSIKESFGHDDRFKIFLKAIQNLGGYGAEFAGSVGLDENDPRLALMEKELRGPNEFWHPNSICHASKFNSFIIRADGRVSKCTTALYDDINIIGRLQRDGSLDLDREKVLAWARGLFDMNRDVLYCPLGGIHKHSACSQCEASGPAAALQA
ncbi:radical SAM protein [Bradyrhizobium sp. USDA 3458]|uniref:radical SAM protein n=1 Tax=Bradyrhizobium sp. USDA 3458 TaxID=2591461 RepID=UPI001144FC48|nr:radical SAM protein [Bradyrhizobium sp. USDA 3458]